MNRVTIFYLFSIFLLLSCNSQEDKPKSPDNIHNVIRDVEEIISRYDNNVQSAIDSKNFDYILTVAQSAIDSTTVRLGRMEELVVPEEYEDLRSAAISYIKSLQEVIKAGEIYSTITEETSASEAIRIDQKVLSTIKQAQVEHIKYEQILERSAQ